jgi:8-oxo-dGTP diphosphatase
MNVALAIILEEEKVLIGKIKPEKANEYGALPYVFPCENVQDENRAPEELIKEVKRHTNIDISILRKIGERVHPSTGNHTYYYLCVKNTEQILKISEDTDIESFFWADVKELQNYMPTLFDGVKENFATIGNS